MIWNFTGSSTSSRKKIYGELVHFAVLVKKPNRRTESDYFKIGFLGAYLKSLVWAAVFFKVETRRDSWLLRECIHRQPRDCE